MTMAAILMGFAQILLLFNFFWSMRFGKRVGRNPWNANGLEWTAPSPPGHGNFDIPPVCYRGPYEYSVPGLAHDFLPQTAYSPQEQRLAESKAIEIH
jgi:cytochrome c oxidase subunit 1